MKLDCAQVTAFRERASAEDLAAPPAEVRAHLESCPYCRSVWNFLAHQDDAEVPAGTNARIEQQLLDSMQPVRPLPSRGTLALGFLAIFTLVAAVIVGYIGMRGAAAMTLLQFAGLLAAVVLSAVLVASMLSDEMTPGARRKFPSWAIIAFGALSTLAVSLVAFPWTAGENWMAGAWHCFRAGFLFSIPAAGLAIALLGRGTVLCWHVVGAGAGLLAGLVGATILHIGCSMHSAPHVAVGHMAVPIVGAALGYALGRAIPIFSGRRSG